jgi:hypothetical protein
MRECTSDLAMRYADRKGGDRRFDNAQQSEESYGNDPDRVSLLLSETSAPEKNYGRLRSANATEA